MATVTIDGSNVTAVCTTKDERGGGEAIEWHRRGGRPSFLTLRGPAGLLNGTIGVSQGVLSGLGAGFTGVLWRKDYEADADDVWATLVFADTSIYFPKRIVKDGEDSEGRSCRGLITQDPGNFSDPSIIEDFLYGPSIMGAAIQNSNDLDGSFGPVGLSVGSVTLDLGTDLTGYRPSGWPLTLDQLRAELSNAGVLAYKMLGTSIRLYEGPTVAGSFVNQPLEYGTGAFNCQGYRYSQEMENVFNVVWSLLGAKAPKCPDDVQHWRGNVTIDDSPLGPNAGIEDRPNDPLEGEYVGIPDPPFSAIAALSLASRSTYGRLQRVDEYDLYKDERTPSEKRAFRRLAQMLWLQTSLYCANPRQMVTMIPEPGVTPSFDVYDTIPVAAGGAVSFSGEQRVYEFKVGIDTEGNATLKEIVTSPNLG